MERTLTLLQVSNKWIQRHAPREAYYDLLYSGVRPGYQRPEHFWEIPLWAAQIAHTIPATRFVVDTPHTHYPVGSHIATSMMEVNRDRLEHLMKHYHTARWYVGGYTKPTIHSNFFDWFDSPAHLTHHLRVPYKAGVDYTHWTGTKTIPRLSLSTGCTHHCTFCDVTRSLVEVPWQTILAEIKSLKPLDFSLVYINDKTFGQASNHKALPAIRDEVYVHCPSWNGFIIQTTADMACRLDPEWLRKYGVLYCEIGVESFNDPILRAMRKPATEALITKATLRLASAGIRVIPNILIGFPGETAETYSRTLAWLELMHPHLSHVNLYTTSVYDGTALARTITPQGFDSDENILMRSWYTDPTIHEEFERDVLEFATSLLKGGTYAQ